MSVKEFMTLKQRVANIKVPKIGSFEKSVCAQMIEFKKHKLISYQDVTVRFKKNHVLKPPMYANDRCMYIYDVYYICY